MHALDFCYWLQGFAEMTEGVPSGKQWNMIKEHLRTVFDKKTPPLGGWTDKGINITPVQESPPPAPEPQADQVKKALDDFFKKNPPVVAPGLPLIPQTPFSPPKYTPPSWEFDRYSLQNPPGLLQPAIC